MSHRLKFLPANESHPLKKHSPALTLPLRSGMVCA